jgi:hypothetical protein
MNRRRLRTGDIRSGHIYYGGPPRVALKLDAGPDGSAMLNWSSGFAAQPEPRRRNRLDDTTFSLWAEVRRGLAPLWCSGGAGAALCFTMMDNIETRRRMQSTSYSVKKAHLPANFMASRGRRSRNTGLSRCALAVSGK